MRARPAWNPPNPWVGPTIAWDEGPPPASVEVLEDATREILSRNASPDVGFRWSVNPYRGCLHACAYCYARPTHEYLGMGAGTDFDTRIVAKRRAPELLREAFDRPAWKGERVAFAGATDAWQPLEAALRLTRRCLEVCAAYRNPVCCVTKSALIARDVDVLQELSRVAHASVSISLPLLDPARARALEPWAPSPAARLRTLEALARAGLSPGVLVAPVIPGLDDELPRVLAAAREAGAVGAAWLLLRLPGSVAEVFASRVRAALPEAAGRILHLVRGTRSGRLSDSRFAVRGRGEGAYAAAIGELFRVTATRLGLRTGDPGPAGPATFRRPGDLRQLGLFGEP